MLCLTNTILSKKLFQLQMYPKYLNKTNNYYTLSHSSSGLAIKRALLIAISSVRQVEAL